MKESHSLSNNRGQFVIEMVLLMVISMMLFAALINTFKEKQIMENILVKPWEKISGMIENGVWGGPAQTRSIHPHNPYSVATLQEKN
jgi:competence protein ComGC